MSSIYPTMKIRGSFCDGIALRWLTETLILGLAHHSFCTSCLFCLFSKRLPVKIVTVSTFSFDSLYLCGEQEGLKMPGLSFGDCHNAAHKVIPKVGKGSGLLDERGVSIVLYYWARSFSMIRPSSVYVTIIFISVFIHL